MTAIQALASAVIVNLNNKLSIIHSFNHSYIHIACVYAHALGTSTHAHL